MSGSEAIGAAPASLEPIASPGASSNSEFWQAEVNWKVEEGTYDLGGELKQAADRFFGHLCTSPSQVLTDLRRAGFLLTYKPSDATQARLDARTAKPTIGDEVSRRLDQFASSGLGSAAFIGANAASADAHTQLVMLDFGTMVSSLLPAAAAAGAYARGGKAVQGSRLKDGWHTGEQAARNQRFANATVSNKPASPTIAAPANNNALRVVRGPSWINPNEAWSRAGMPPRSRQGSFDPLAFPNAPGSLDMCAVVDEGSSGGEDLGLAPDASGEPAHPLDGVTAWGMSGSNTYQDPAQKARWDEVFRSSDLLNKRSEWTRTVEKVLLFSPDYREISLRELVGRVTHALDKQDIHYQFELDPQSVESNRKLLEGSQASKPPELSKTLIELLSGWSSTKPAEVSAAEKKALSFFDKPKEQTAALAHEMWRLLKTHAQETRGLDTWILESLGVDSPAIRNLGSMLYLPNVQSALAHAVAEAEFGHWDASAQQTPDQMKALVKTKLAHIGYTLLPLPKKVDAKITKLINESVDSSSFENTALGLLPAPHAPGEKNASRAEVDEWVAKIFEQKRTLSQQHYFFNRVGFGYVADKRTVELNARNNELASHVTKHPQDIDLVLSKMTYPKLPESWRDFEEIGLLTERHLRVKGEFASMHDKLSGAGFPLIQKWERALKEGVVVLQDLLKHRLQQEGLEQLAPLVTRRLNNAQFALEQLYEEKPILRSSH